MEGRVVRAYVLSGQAQSAVWHVFLDGFLPPGAASLQSLTEPLGTLRVPPGKVVRTIAKDKTRLRANMRLALWRVDELIAE